MAWLAASSLVASSSDFRIDRDETDFGVLGRETFWDRFGEDVIDLAGGAAVASSCVEDVRLDLLSGVGRIVDRLRLPLLFGRL